MKLNPFNKNKNRIDMDPKEKKTKKEEELTVDDIQDTVEGQSQNEEATEESTPLTAEEKLEKELEEAHSQIEDQKDKYLRLSAEFDNYRKRTEKEKSSMYIIGARDIVEKMLPIVDNFERGLAQAPEDDSFAEGMKMIYRQMMTAFDEMGVKPIEAVGKEFDI